MCKLVHTCIAEGKDPKEELYNYLLQYRATPHSTTGISPEGLLFGGKVQTKLPQISVTEDTEEIKEVRKRHDREKMRQKHYFDKGHQAYEKVIKVGDQVLVKQNKTTIEPPQNPNPYTVADVQSNQLVLTRDDGSCKI